MKSFFNSIIQLINIYVFISRLPSVSLANIDLFNGNVSDTVQDQNPRYLDDLKKWGMSNLVNFLDMGNSRSSAMSEA